MDVEGSSSKKELHFQFLKGVLKVGNKLTVLTGSRIALSNFPLAVHATKSRLTFTTKVDGQLGGLKATFQSFF